MSRTTIIDYVVLDYVIDRSDSIGTISRVIDIIYFSCTGRSTSIATTRNSNNNSNTAAAVPRPKSRHMHIQTANSSMHTEFMDVNDPGDRLTEYAK